MAERRAPRGHWANVASATRAQSFRTHEVGVAVLDSVRFGKRGDRVQPRIALEEVERRLGVLVNHDRDGEHVSLLARAGIRLEQRQRIARANHRAACGRDGQGQPHCYGTSMGSFSTADRIRDSRIAVSRRAGALQRMENGADTAPHGDAARPRMSLLSAKRKHQSVEPKAKTQRWRTSQQSEDYVSLVADMMAPSVTFGAYGYDHEQVPRIVAPATQPRAITAA